MAPFSFVDNFFYLSLWLIAHVFTSPTQKGLIKHQIALAIKRLSQSDISWTNQNISLSRRICKFWKAQRIIRCFNSLLKGLLGFLSLLEFSRSQLINIHFVTNQRKSPDNWCPDNIWGSTVDQIISQVENSLPDWLKSKMCHKWF